MLNITGPKAKTRFLPQLTHSINNKRNSFDDDNQLKLEPAPTTDVLVKKIVNDEIANQGDDENYWTNILIPYLNQMSISYQGTKRASVFFWFLQLRNKKVQSYINIQLIKVLQFAVLLVIKLQKINLNT